MKEADSVEILIVGNELLNGTTLDTNSNWLSKRLTRLGAIIIRKTTLPDDLKVVSKAFESAISSGSRWIFSLGGLGPTYDDMTLRALSFAVKRPIGRNEDAVEMIRESRERRMITGGKLPKRLSQATLKMAEIPRGAVPLRNSAGTAPGVLLISRNSKVVSLPGVPREMRAIFLEQVLPILKEELPSFKRQERWLYSLGASESSIAPQIKKLMKKYAPEIYIKSHPVGFRRNLSALRFQISAFSSEENKEESAKILSTATSDLKASLAKAGATVKATNSV